MTHQEVLELKADLLDAMLQRDLWANESAKLMTKLNQAINTLELHEAPKAD